MCALAVLATTCLLGIAAPAAAAAPNPAGPRACSADVTLLLDASGSVQTAGARPAMRRGARALLAALDGTGATARITQFATFSEELAARTTVDAEAMADGGSLDRAVAAYLEPEPQRPPGAHVHRYLGGSPTDPDSFAPADASTLNTNWDAALEQAVEPAADLAILVTDGREPTAYDLDEAGDPFDPGPPPDVAIETQRGPAAETSLARAAAAADQVKAHTRVLVVGVGLSPSDTASRARLAALSGPQTLVHPDPSQPPALDQVDIALLAGYDDVAPFLESVVRGLCGSALTVRALADGPGLGYEPAAGQSVTVTPEVAGGFVWILPADATGTSARVATDPSGRSRFQWHARSAGPTTTQVAAALPAGYAAGRPGDADYRCRVTRASGEVEAIQGEFADPMAPPQLVVAAASSDAVACDYYLTYDRRPALAVTVAATPAALRGDLDPPARVTASIVVRNTGNVALSQVELSTGPCSDLTRVDGPGSQAGDGTSLEVGRAWTFTCRQPVRAAAPDRPAPLVPVRASASAVDAAGRGVTAQAQTTVTALAPAMALAASLDLRGGEAAIEGEPVRLLLDLTAVGNAALGRPTWGPGLPCTPRAGSAELTPAGRTLRWTCTFAPRGSGRLQLSASATALGPDGAPLDHPNPPVGATASLDLVVVPPFAPAPPTPGPSGSATPSDTARPTPTEAPRPDPTSPRPSPVSSSATAGATSTPSSAATATPSPAPDDPSASSDEAPPEAPQTPQGADLGGTEGAPPAPSAAFSLAVGLDVVPGQTLEGRSVSVRATHLLPGSPVTATVYSQPYRVVTGTAGSDGTFSSAAPLPTALPPGAHTLIVEATSAAGRRVTAAGGFLLDDQRRVAAVAAPRLLLDAQPGDPRVQRALQTDRAPYDPRTDPATTAAIVTTVAVVAAVGATGVSRRGGGGRSRGKASLKGIIPKRIKDPRTVEPQAGDLSGSWRWPLTDRTDAFARWLPTLWATRTFLVARLGLDGTWARAMLGSLGYGLWVIAAVLAVASSQLDAGAVVPPPMPLLLALVALGILDASAGAIAFLVMALISLLSGNVTTADDVRTLLGLGSLLVWPVLLTNAIRPLRRPDWWSIPGGRQERLYDYLIPPVVVAFLTGGVAKALNGLSGLELVTAADVAAVRWVAGLLVVARYVIEDVALRYYPRRVAEITPAKVPWPTRGWSLAGNVVRFVVFVFVAMPFFGLTVATLVAAFLTVLPGLVGLFEERLPESAWLSRWLPKGMLKVVFLIVVGSLWAKLYVGDGSDAAVRTVMVFMIVPGLAFALLETFAGSSPGWPDTVYKRIGGAAVFVVLLGFTTGLLSL